MGDPFTEPARDRPPPAPRWVKASAVAFVVLAATVLIIHLLGGGFGNHMRH